MQQSPPTESDRDGSSLLGLAHWLDTIEVELADLSERVMLSRRNQAEVYHSQRLWALGEALSRVGGTVSKLLNVLPVGTGTADDPEARTICMGLIAQWLFSESQSNRAAKAGIHGNTDSFALPTVLEFLAMQRKSGLVKVKAADETFILELHDGDLVHAVSDNAPPGERLGEVLVELGHLKREQLEAVVGPRSRTRERLGLELSDRGLIRDDQLRDGLECQVHRILMRLFAKTNATFEFHEATSQRHSTKVRLPTLPLLLEVRTQRDNERILGG